MKKKGYRILILQVAPQDLDLSLGILFQKGLTTVEQKRNRHGLWLLVEMPFDQDLRKMIHQLLQFKKSGNGGRVFLSLKYKTILEGRWARAYQKHLKPFPLFSPQTPPLPMIWVDPRKNHPKHPKGSTLFIEPGLAFGTGNHASTRLAATLMAEVFLKKPTERVLDLGCGTGILAMAAKNLGVSEVWAVDNDPTALEVAALNFKKNKLNGIFLEENLDRAKKPFQVIVANILLSILIKLRKEIVEHLSPGGFLILSGLLYKDCEPIRKAYSELRLIRRLNEKGWAALLLRKRA